MASGDTKTEALLNILGHGGSVDGITGSGNTKTQDYLVDAIGRLQGIQDEVDELKNNPDVVDIVDTYADLQAYDTKHLSNNDIIRVLADETHSGNSTYYKFNKQADTWTFIGEIAGSGSVFTKLTSADYDYPTNNPTGIAAWKLDAGLYYFDSNVYVNLSTGTNTHYGGFMVVSGEVTDTRRLIWISEADSGNKERWMLFITNATNGDLAEYYQTLFRGDVVNSLTSTSTSFPLSARQGKALKDLIDSLVISGAGAPTTSTVGTVGMLYEDTTNGKLYQCTAASGSTYTWTEVGGGGSGPTVVQTTGTSTTDVMSQKATTSMVFNDPSTQEQVKIGANSSNGYRTVAIGSGAKSGSARGVAIGEHSWANSLNSVAIGAGAKTTVDGEFNIGCSAFSGVGYNSSDYRLLTGLYDPQSSHDAATQGYVDSVAGAAHVLSALDINLSAGESPSGNPAIGLWLLSPGLYYAPASLTTEIFPAYYDDQANVVTALPTGHVYNIMVDTDENIQNTTFMTVSAPIKIDLSQEGTLGNVWYAEVDTSSPDTTIIQWAPISG